MILNVKMVGLWPTDSAVGCHSQGKYFEQGLGLSRPVFSHQKQKQHSTSKSLAFLMSQLPRSVGLIQSGSSCGH